MVRRKKSMRVNRYIYFHVNLWVGTPVDEFTGNCADNAEIEEQTEQV